MRKAAVAIFVALACMFAAMATTYAKNNALNWQPAKLKLTIHQEKLLFDAATKGVDSVVMPLTQDQIEYLKRVWPGWSADLLTVHVSDMLDRDGSVYVVPDWDSMPEY